ncbi:unnamed protein product [Mesocestoides corti]|uniref:Neurotransmitter-gated ion-channel ligand-binding domain-containing protein n=1 Tax=Mesocestoides corti TaxID=53468 RepID=A0A158QSU6_MESCO|nr:unnamed protein product [Mesocestoides corti]
MGVKLSVAVESAEFGHAYDDYVCRATIRLVTSWPIMDTKISDNTLVRMAGGTVMLDADRVWRPRVMVSGARHMKLFSRRLELQSFGKSSPPHRSLMQKGDADYGSGGEVSAQGPQSNLSINLCFNPTALVLRAALPALLFTFLSFILLWSLPCGPQIISITQGGLVLLCLATWTHFSVAIPTHFSLVDAWFILCLAFISMTFLFTLYEHRRLDRLAKTRQIQQQRRIYSALSATALCVPKMPPCGAAGGGGGGGSGGSTCGCGGCSCAGGFCGAGGGFLGIGNGQTSQMGSGGSPPPLGLMHQASPVVMPTKLDICNEAYFRSVSSELSKDSSAIMSLGTALRLRCAKNGGLGVFEPNDSNLGLIKSQYALGSTPSTHPAPSGSFLQPLGPIAPSYCTTVVAVALPILYILAIIIFWGFFGAQGTVPKDCLVGSVTCQALDRS